MATLTREEEALTNQMVSRRSRLTRDYLGRIGEAKPPDGAGAVDAAKLSPADCPARAKARTWLAAGELGVGVPTVQPKRAIEFLKKTCRRQRSERAPLRKNSAGDAKERGVEQIRGKLLAPGLKPIANVGVSKRKNGEATGQSLTTPKKAPTPTEQSAGAGSGSGAGNKDTGAARAGLRAKASLGLVVGPLPEAQRRSLSAAGALEPKTAAAQPGKHRECARKRWPRANCGLRQRLPRLLT